MTFKDVSVLVENDEYEGDVLENVELQSSFRQKLKMKKQNDNNGYNAGQNVQKILPQYNSEDEDEVAKKQNRIILSTEGDQSGLTKEQRLEELREKLNQKSKLKVSLDIKKVN